MPDFIYQVGGGRGWLKSKRLFDLRLNFWWRILEIHGQ
jgi:hypothetical protein